MKKSEKDIQELKDSIHSKDVYSKMRNEQEESSKEEMKQLKAKNESLLQNLSEEKQKNYQI